MSDSKIHPAVDTHPEVNPSEGRPGHFPALPLREWITYGLLAGALAVTNIYTTLLTGWGDGGSLIAVVAAVGILSVFRRRAHIQSLNLGQTMASAGGTVGFAATSYAAVRIAFPDYHANAFMLGVLFFGVGMMGVVLGSVVRKQMIKYYFPSGTACAVIQKAVTDRSEAAKRPVRLLGIFSAIAAVWSTLATITFDKAKNAKVILHDLHVSTVHGSSLGISFNPVYYGIGIVVGPRVGLGLLMGALAGPLVLFPQLQAHGIDASHNVDWLRWVAIAVLTLPTFATLLFAYMFRTPAVVPAGFKPGVTKYPTPANLRVVYAVLAVIGAGITVLSAGSLFDLPWYTTLLVGALCVPLCIMNGRVTGDTDINPVRLVIIVILTVFALALSTTATMLLGMAIIATMLAGMAVDMMQDFRTGYLVDANPTHQSTLQFIGVVVGVLVAVPFILFLDKNMGFGSGTTFPAPGPTVYATMAKAYAGHAYMTHSLELAIALVSLGGCVYAFFTVWPRVAGLMPSLFGIGIGMLLPFESCAAIFVGGLIKWIVTQGYTSKAKLDGKAEAADKAQNDTLLIGSGIFAAAAIIAVVHIIISHTTHLYYVP